MQTNNPHELVNSIINVFDKLGVAIIIALLSYFFAKRQLSNNSVLQYRQKWLDDLRNGISQFISEAEVISMLELNDNQRYFEHFKEFSKG